MADLQNQYFKDGLDGYESRIDVRNFAVAKDGEVVLLDYKVEDTILRARLRNHWSLERNTD